ncbi:eukaryotic translation initiation factor 4G [Arabidopsis thaliana]|uniref:Isoform 2 of Eukaryotic translation initiation factor 4G n=1 Tax=Arabidopsis thaliana TaxID=3702 RepID=Q76E23-2|nr:eukaryotic translation initiation factor 4G [Arabidopsis thaliana]AEE80027.1 eukaryotic translation initiation factor 4G [Arabidopsis thaliana]BAC98352.1 eukaryotic translation initiation factor 4G [Arabidopsis thaliana]|eukprot:NP_001078318.1 eukaryotic translation initiation factor 4G [Arabidopsis thaliana]
MSYNQSRPDRSETQYRRTGRSTGNQQQQQQHRSSSAAGYGKGAGAPGSAPAPSTYPDNSSLSSNRSFKKPGNAQGGGQPRVNLPPVNHPNNHNNGPNAHSRSQGEPGVGGPTNPTESFNRNTGPIPKAPTSQSTVMSSKINETPNTAKVAASGDASQAFPLQFGSLGPDLMVPARTTSAPPNMDDQKRAQMQQSSLRTASNVPASVPKKDSSNKGADNQLMRKEGHNPSSEKADIQVPHIAPPSQTQKSPITNIRMPSVQTPYQHTQVPHPVHFGGPNMHMQTPVTATSFQMPMPMALSMGNTPQIPPQVFYQGHPPHPMHHQGMMHQAQGHGFATPMGAQIHPQLGHVGVGLSPQYPQQQGGKYGGARKTTPVKITHPDTHEELRLDRRGDPYSEGDSTALKPHSNPPPRSQPVSSFAPRPVNLVQPSYNSNTMIYPPVSVPLNNGPMSSAQAPRYHYPVIDGSQRVQLINQPAHTAPQLIRPAAPAHLSSDSTSSVKARNAQNVMSSALPVNAKVSVKPAGVSEKLGSPKDRSHGEVNISLSQKNVEACSLSSSQQPKPSFVSGVPNSSAPPAKSPVETVPLAKSSVETVPPVKSSVETAPVTTTEIRRAEMVSESISVEDQTCKVEPPHNLTENRGQTMPDSLVSDPETATVAAKENLSLPATNGFRKQLLKVSTTSDAPTSDSVDTSIDKSTEGSSHASSEISGSSPQEKDLKCDNRTASDKLDERSVISDAKHETLSGVLEKAQNEVDGATDVCPVSEKLAVTDDTSSDLPHSTHVLSSTVPLGHSETHKSAVETNTRRNTSTKGKKKIKEILQKADAAGTTSDLYMAYKGPEEKKESSNVVHDVSNQNLLPAIPQAVEAIVDTEPVKNEPEDWEDAADVSTPKLETADNSVNAKRGSSDEVSDNCINTEKKYSRDFLLKFADLCTALPEGFDVSPDIANALIVAYMGASHHEHDSYPTPGKVMDRQASGARLDRRPSNVAGDDRWTKNQGSLPAGYGGNVGFRPGQGGNSGVLRNPRMQGPIISRPMQPVGPMGGMGRNTPDLERWQRGSNFQQKGLFPSPHTPMQVMHKAERKYQVGTIADEEQAKQRQLKSILNKLTPQNFEKLFEQVKSVNIDNAVTLSGVISQIFDKALMEPTFCEMYADFCFHLSGALPDFNENGEKITFKRLLLNKCQEEFERGEKEEEEASRVAEEGQVEQTEEEREEKRLQVRRRMLGNIRLIGELYKKRMLTEKIMHACIQKLLGYNQDPHEENIEALCKLMSTIGVMIDHNKAKFQMDGYFEKMKMLSCKQELSSRVRFMLINAIDLRKNKWQERMKVEGPKKIEEVHRDAAQERQTQANRLSRGPSMNSSGRRGHMEFSSPRGGGGMLSPPAAQMGSYHGPPQGRGFSNQDIRFDDRPSYEPRMVPMPQRSVCEEPITLGPQGGLGQGMSIRRPAVASNTYQSDATQAGGGDSRRPAGGLNGFGSHRPASPVTHGRSSPQERGTAYVHREFASLSRASDLSPEVSSARQVLQGPSATVNSPRENALSEEQLENLSLSAIKEYYSARDENEIGMCMKDMNSPAYHPTMISLWVTDSFERKDKERDLLAKLLVNLVKSADNALNEVQLVKGFESVLKTLEDAVNDAPKAAEFLGRIFGKSVTEKVVTLTEIGRLIQEGGEEPGSLIEFGLGGDVLGSVLEMIKTEAGEETLVEIRRSSGLRIENFKPHAPNRSKILEKFT